MSTAPRGAGTGAVPGDASRPAPHTLEATGVEVRYQNALGAESISIRAHVGETIAILGPNGAGKTTLLRAISGFIPGDRARVTRGTITVNGVSVVGKSPSEIARLGVALVPERDKVFAELTVWQNLQVAGTRRGPTKDQLDEAVALFPIIGRRKTQFAGSLSGGERQMLALARALLLRPQLLLIDELSFGLAPVVLEDIIARIATVASQDRAIVVVEQNLSVATRLAGRGYALSAGRVTAAGSMAELADVVTQGDAYFGENAGR